MTAESGRRGIPTTHAGTRFRSRLEARWAAFFDAIGWAWEYEPFDLDGYIPDFVLLGDAPVLVEVRPIATVAEAEHIANCVPLHPTYPPLVVGCAPLLPDWSGEPCCIGAVGQYGYGDPDDLSDNLGVCEAEWGSCVACGRLYVVHVGGGWVPHPDSCSHLANARSGARGPGIGPEEEQGIRRLWAEARNATQWRPR